MPIAAVVASRQLFRCWETQGEARHTATFIANPVACAAALAVLDILEEEELPARAARVGETVRQRLSSWPGRHSGISAIRGRGLLWGVELRSAEIAKRWAGEALAKGVIFLAGGPQGRVAQIVPPLTIPEELLETALDLLEGALG